MYLFFPDFINKQNSEVSMILFISNFLHTPVRQPPACPCSAVPSTVTSAHPSTNHLKPQGLSYFHISKISESIAIMKALQLNASEATFVMPVFYEPLVILDATPHKDFNSYSLKSLKTGKMRWALFHFVVTVKYSYPCHQLFCRHLFRALMEILICPC